MRNPVRFTAMAVVVVAVLSQSACSGDSPPPPDPSSKDGMTPTEQLLQRPTVDEAAKMYESQLIKVRSALKELAPTVGWDDEPPVRGSAGTCEPPFSRVPGAVAFDYVTGGGAIPDEDWDEAVAVTTRILQAEGYDQVSVLVNKPGSHSVVFTGRYGATIDLVGRRSTVISLNTSGCFLNADAHQAAKP